MKKLVFPMLALMLIGALTACDSGAAEPEVAAGYLPEGAEFVKSELDGGYTELKYRDAEGGTYELVMDDKTAVCLEYDSNVNSAAAEATLTEAEAFAVVTALYPDAELISAASEFDDGGWEWTVVFRTADLTGVYELDAASGAILEYSLFYDAVGDKDPTALIYANYPQALITHMSMDIDDGRIAYEGKALTDNRVYEFKIDAGANRIVEWEMDD